eukprot:1113314-Rhodomonas_salina.1
MPSKASTTAFQITCPVPRQTDRHRHTDTQTRHAKCARTCDEHFPPLALASLFPSHAARDAEDTGREREEEQEEEEQEGKGDEEEGEEEGREGEEGRA